MSHPCAKRGCQNDATHIVIESHPLAMLFQSGAGLACAGHAAELAAVGGASFEVAELVGWRQQRDALWHAGENVRGFWGIEQAEAGGYEDAMGTLARTLDVMRELVTPAMNQEDSP
jgi:hypothetical protein